MVLLLPYFHPLPPPLHHQQYHRSSGFLVAHILCPWIVPVGRVSVVIRFSLYSPALVAHSLPRFHHRRCFCWWSAQRTLFAEDVERKRGRMFITIMSLLCSRATHPAESSFVSWSRWFSVHLPSSSRRRCVLGVTQSEWNEKETLCSLRPCEFSSSFAAHSWHISIKMDWQKMLDSN